MSSMRKDPMDRMDPMAEAASRAMHREPEHGHGYSGPLASKVRGGAHTKPITGRAGKPQGDRIAERTRGLS